MSKMTVAQLLSNWPDIQSVHEDARAGDRSLQLVAVRRWVTRQSIPARFWYALVEGAKSRKLEVTLDALALAHSPDIQVEDAA